MARRRLIAGIAFTGLGWGLFLAHSEGFSQNPPGARAETPAAVTDNSPDARAETQAAIAKYCTTCHSERLKTAGLVLDPAGVARPGDQSETWEKVLRQLRAGTMPPPGAARPPQALYARAAGYLARELEASAAARPNPGPLPLAHRLTRTEYANVIRDLLALPDLPKEFDYATLLPADNASSGFDNLADTLFVSPATMERYLAAALKISRVAVGDPGMGALVNTHITPVRQPQDRRNEALPFGTRGGLQIDGYFPLDAEYEFKVETDGAGADVHQLEISIDGERKAITNVSRRPGVPAADDAPNNQGAFRFAVPAGPRSVSVAFVERSEALSEAPLRPPGRNRGALPSVVSVTITGPFNATGPGDTPSRRRLFVCRPASADQESACADRILTTLLRRAYRRNVTADDLAPRAAVLRSRPRRTRFRPRHPAGVGTRAGQPAVPVPHRAGSGRRRAGIGPPRRRFRAGLTPLVLPLVQHARRRAAGCRGRGNAAPTRRPAPPGDADACRSAQPLAGDQLRRPVAVPARRRNQGTGRLPVPRVRRGCARRVRA